MIYIIYDLYIYIYDLYIYIYDLYIYDLYIYTANCINFGKPKHVVKKASIGKSVTMISLINLNTLDWPKNVPKNT